MAKKKIKWPLKDKLKLAGLLLLLIVVGILTILYVNGINEAVGKIGEPQSDEPQPVTNFEEKSTGMDSGNWPQVQNR